MECKYSLIREIFKDFNESGIKSDDKLGEVARKIHSKTANVLLFPLSEIKVKKVI